MKLVLAALVAALIATAVPARAADLPPAIGLSAAACGKAIKMQDMKAQLDTCKHTAVLIHELSLAQKDDREADSIDVVAVEFAVPAMEAGYKLGHKAEAIAALRGAYSYLQGIRDHDVANPDALDRAQFIQAHIMAFVTSQSA